MDACTESRILAINLSLAPKIEISVRARCFENPHCKCQKIFFSYLETNPSYLCTMMYIYIMYKQLYYGMFYI